MSEYKSRMDGPASRRYRRILCAFITRFIEPGIDDDKSAVLDGYVETLEGLVASGE